MGWVHQKKMRMQQHAHKVGKFGENGNKIKDINQAQSYSGKLYDSHDEAVNLTRSTDEGVMGSGPENIKKTKRENLFNNPSNTFGN